MIRFPIGKYAHDHLECQCLLAGSKKSVQQGHSHFCARSVYGVREHGKMARTPLAAFFNRPGIGLPWSTVRPLRV